MPTRAVAVKNKTRTRSGQALELRRMVWQARAVDLAVVIPTLNAARNLPATIGSIGGVPREIIVADGGSDDDTVGIARRFGCRSVVAPRGRGSQLAAGVAAAQAPWLLLLHADTRLAPGWAAEAARHIATHPDKAGYFRFRLDDDAPAARRLERAVAWRCRVLALPYGDQGLLVAASLLRAVGGIRPIPLLEDVDLVRRLGRAKLVALESEAVTSAARYRRDGYLRRGARNLALLGLWFAGVPPRLLARLY